MTTETHTIEIPDTPKSVNQGGGGVRSPHWGVAFKEKQRWQDEFSDELIYAGVEKGMTHCTVDITLRFKSSHRRDVENYRHPTIKPLADALVAGGWLKDDTEDWFEVRSFRLEVPREWPPERWVQSRLQVQIRSTLTVTLECSYARPN